MISENDTIYNEINEFKEKIDLYIEGKLSADDFKRRRLHQGIYGIRAQTDIQMVRVKIPSGILKAEHLECMADIADKFARGIAHITTRQDVQFHWVRLIDVVEVIRRLSDIGLTTREACGNTVRNVTACYLAGLCPYEIFDVTPYSLGMAKFLLRNPICQALPRKFKISFSGCPKDCALSGIHDIGALAVKKRLNGHSQLGFKLFVGGGLGPVPKPAQALEDFISPDELLPTCEAVINVFDRLGERKNRARSRMKFLVADLGIDKFRYLVFEERSKIMARTPEGQNVLTSEITGYVETTDVSAPHMNSIINSNDLEFNRWAETNVKPQRQENLSACVIRLIRGDIRSEQMRGLAKLARGFSDGNVRTTITQNIVLVNVKKETLYNLYNNLKEFGLHKSGANLGEDIVSCPGTETCQLGIVSSRGLALELTNLFERMPRLRDILKDVSIKISGCPNSCGQHHIAALGFYGGARQLDNKLIPYYQFIFGGLVEGGMVNFAKPVIKLPAKRVPAMILRLVSMYEKDASAGRESFLAYFKRIGVEKMSQGLLDFEKPLPYAEAKDEYIDWGKTEEFNLVGMGPGECAM